MQMGHVAPSLAYCTVGVKNHNDCLDNLCMRVQDLALSLRKWGHAMVTHAA
jgi:hypothetical protein